MNLKLDWATHAAAKYACEHWHYSKCVPKSKLVKIGVWEDKKFIGVIIYGLGATPNLSKPYGLNMQECCELVRIALTKHITPVSKIMAISLKLLKEKCPNLQLIVSFADPQQKHIGSIYQAANWVYTGNTGGDIFYRKDDRLIHGRTLGDRHGTRSIKTAKSLGYEIVRSPGKHRYLMPLNKHIRNRIIKLSKPYPKRVESKDNVALANHAREDGANPISTLQDTELITLSAEK